MNRYYLLFIVCIAFQPPVFGMDIESLLGLNTDGQPHAQENKRRRMPEEDGSDAEKETEGMEGTQKKRQKTTVESTPIPDPEKLKEVATTYLKYLSIKKTTRGKAKNEEESKVKIIYDGIMKAFKRIYQFKFFDEYDLKPERATHRKGIYLSTFTMSPEGKPLTWNGVEIDSSLILSTKNLLTIFYPMQEERKKFYYTHTCTQTNSLQESIYKPIKTFNHHGAMIALKLHQETYHKQDHVCPQPLNKAPHCLLLQVRCNGCEKHRYFTNSIDFAYLQRTHEKTCTKESSTEQLFTLKVYETEASQEPVREYKPRKKTEKPSALDEDFSDNSEQ